MTGIYLDTEFAKFNGELISMALVVDRHDYLYMVRSPCEIQAIELGCDDSDGWKMDTWVAKNVIPFLFDVPADVRPRVIECPLSEMGSYISDFIYDRVAVPHIVCDWPEDLVHLNRLLLTGPGQAVYMESATQMTVLRHIDVYPTTLVGAVQHNAWWDAMALREYCK